MSDNLYAAPASDPTPVINTGTPVIPWIKDLQYPLQLNFKIVALAPQLTITDATGKEVVYIKQKLFKFKEKVEVFSDKSKSQLLGSIKANKIIDWSARYFFRTANEEAFGSVGRKGMRSLWKASYFTFSHDSDTPEYNITEENPCAKIFDSLLGEIPIVGFATAFLFHPKYGAINNENNQTVMRLTKQPALFQGKFQLEKYYDLSPEDESSLLFSFIMLVLLERARG